MISSSFLSACLERDYGQIELCLQANKLAIRESFLNGDTGLHLAAKHNDVKLVKLLLKYQVNINQANIFQLTPLMLACKFCNHAVIRLLLKEENIKVNIQDNGGNSAIFYAFQNDDVQTIKTFTQESMFWTVDWNLENHLKQSVPYLALKSGSKLMRQQLLTIQTIDWLQIDVDGNNGPMLAVGRDLSDVFQIFLRRYAFDINCQNSMHETAAMLAIKNKSKKCIEILKTLDDVQWNLKSKLQETPLSLCLQFDEQLFAFLLQNDRFEHNLCKELPSSLHKAALLSTIHYVQSMMGKDYQVQTTQNHAPANLFQEFMFALENDLNSSVIEILIPGLSAADIVLLITQHWKNDN